MDNHATMTATPDEIVTKLVEKEAAINTENGLAPGTLLFAQKGVKGGGGSNGGKAGKAGRSPKWDKRDDKKDNKGDNDRKEKDFRKCFHWQPQGNTTENCLSKQRSNPSKSAVTAANASTEPTSTLPTSIENYWIGASTSASSSD
jgi:hypothetical protein